MKFETNLSETLDFLTTKYLGGAGGEGSESDSDKVILDENIHKELLSKKGFIYKFTPTDKEESKNIALLKTYETLSVPKYMSSSPAEIYKRFYNGTLGEIMVRNINLLDKLIFYVSGKNGDDGVDLYQEGSNIVIDVKTSKYLFSNPNNQMIPIRKRENGEFYKKTNIYVAISLEHNDIGIFMGHLWKKDVEKYWTIRHTSKGDIPGVNKCHLY